MALVMDKLPNFCPIAIRPYFEFLNHLKASSCLYEYATGQREEILIGGKSDKMMIWVGLELGWRHDQDPRSDC